MEIEPRPKRCRAGHGITRTHQLLIDLAIDSLQDDGMPDLDSDDEDQESVNITQEIEVQDDGIITVHNINNMAFPDEDIRINKQTEQIVPLHNIATVPHLESWAVSDNGASEALNMYEANDIWIQHGKDQRVHWHTCRRMIWQRRVRFFLDYKFANSTDSDCIELLHVFHLQSADALHNSAYQISS